MLASQLITQLKKLIARHGDCHVYVTDNDVRYVIIPDYSEFEQNIEDLDLENIVDQQEAFIVYGKLEQAH